MATITINIPDAVLPRVVEAVAVTKGYQATDPFTGEPNPMTKGQFAKAHLLDYLKGIVRAYESALAADQAAADAAAAADSQILLT